MCKIWRYKMPNMTGSDMRAQRAETDQKANRMGRHGFRTIGKSNRTAPPTRRKRGGRLLPRPPARARAWAQNMGARSARFGPDAMRKILSAARRAFGSLTLRRHRAKLHTAHTAHTGGRVGSGASPYPIHDGCEREGGGLGRAHRDPASRVSDRHRPAGRGHGPTRRGIDQARHVDSSGDGGNVRPGVDASGRPDRGSVAARALTGGLRRSPAHAPRAIARVSRPAPRAGCGAAAPET